MAAIPGPRNRLFGLPLAGRLRRDRIGTLRQLANAYGDVVGFRVGRQPFVLLNHPDHVEDVLITRARLFKKGRALERARRVLGNGLLTSEADVHLRQRRLVQPAFHKDRIAAYAGTMIVHASRAAERWREGEELDVAGEMNRVTLTIVADTLFGADVGAEAAEVRRALTSVFEMFPITMSPFAPVLERLPLPVVRRYRRAQAHLDRVIFRIIDERRARPVDRGDLLSMLLLASDEEGDGGGMTDAQVRDEVMTLFLAGHETTANALTWTWLLLAQNPDIEPRLHAELDAVLGPRPPQVEDVSRLAYTRRVLAESMRCYPPAWAIGRRALEDFEIGGYTVRRGTVVLVSQYLLHHDARFFCDPERFDPDRWLPERLKSRPKYAYFPFGGGTRVCVGESFAWTEGILVLATLAQRWRLVSLESAPVPMQPVITLRPARAVRMRVTARSAVSPASATRSAGL
jgi:cytochrome P450